MTGKVPSFSPGFTVSSALPGYVALCLTLQVHRLVSGLGSDPVISVVGHQDGGIQVVCRSSGWYPEPEAQWRDLQGQLLPSASEKISQEADGLFQTEIAIVLTEESNQKVSCFVRNPHLNQERESAISIAELYFPRVNPWMVALWVILAVRIPLSICFFWIVMKEEEWHYWMKILYFVDVILAPLTVLCVLASNWLQHRAKERLRSELERQKAARRAEKDKLQAELRWRSSQIYAVDVTLDPETAHPNLILSEDWKHVRYGDTRQDLPDNPERFDSSAVVLGAEGFAGGRHYWEVEVGDKTEWELGVCRETVSRKGPVTLTTQQGYWAVTFRNEDKYSVSTSPWIPLPVSVRPVRVGIFLDYEVGKVSFYNVTDRSHLFTFTGTFSGTLRPYFSPGETAEETNVAPLIICPVPAEAGGNLGP